ncbi:MAG: cell division protein FtsQ/DivIB [Gemmatimonadales bacterium]
MNRIRRRALQVVAVLVVGLVAWFGLPAVLRTLDFFRVRRVEVYGARYVSGPELVSAMGIPSSASVFDATGPWQDGVAALEGIESVEIARRLPGTIRVTVREAEPVALVSHEGALALVDARGTVLPFLPARVAADLPILTAGPRVAGVVARIKAIHPELYAELITVARVRGHVVLEAGPRRLLVRTDASVEEIQNMAAVAQELARNGQTWRELDGRFSGLVVVRGMGG